MQNEPNFRKPKMNVTSAKTSYYENNRLLECQKNEPNFEENEPNLRKNKAKTQPFTSFILSITPCHSRESGNPAL